MGIINDKFKGFLLHKVKSSNIKDGSVTNAKLAGLISEDKLTTALQAKVNTGKIAGTFSVALPTAPIATDKIYDFVGVDNTTIGGIAWRNGDSAYYNGSIWTRIPFQSLSNYVSKLETDLPCFQRFKAGNLTDTINSGGVSFFSFYYAIKSIEIFGYEADMQYQYNPVIIYNNHSTSGYRIYIYRKLPTDGDTAWVAAINTGIITPTIVANKHTTINVIRNGLTATGFNEYANTEANNLGCKIVLDYSLLGTGSDALALNRPYNPVTTAPLFIVKQQQIKLHNYSQNLLFTKTEITEKLSTKKAFGSLQQIGLAHDNCFMAAKYEQSKPYSVEAENYNKNKKRVLIPNTQKMFLAYSWSDGRAEDINFTLPLLLKYGFKNTFALLNNGLTNTSGTSNPTRAKSILKAGMDVMLHGAPFSYTFLYNNPLFDGTFPTNAQLRTDAGGGLNVFGKTISSAIGSTLVDVVNASGVIQNLSAVTWAGLSDTQCGYIRNSYSAYYRYGLKTLLDELSNKYCGTTSGIFQGLATYANHEIWERLITIQLGYFQEYFGTDKQIRNWFAHGGSSFNAWFKSGSYYYHDAAATKPASEWAKFTSVLTGESRSWADVLRKFGIVAIHGATHTNDTAFGNNTRFGNKGFKWNLDFKNRSIEIPENTIRIWDWVNTTTYSSLTGALTTNTNWLKYIFDNNTTFRNGILSLVQKANQGKIPSGAEDMFGSFIGTTFLFDWVMACELFLQFCKLANIELISYDDAIDLISQPLPADSNLFPNADFRTTIKDVINPSSPVNAPDGWDYGIVINDTVNGVLTRVYKLDSGITNTNLYVYSIKKGILNFTCYAKKTTDNCTIKIYKILEKFEEGSASEIVTEDNKLLEIVVNTTDYALYSGSVKIDISSYNESWYENILNSDTAVRTYAQCQGYDNNIAGIYVRFGGEGLHVALPTLK